MAETYIKDAVPKERIIQHMNKDHQDSLVRYLEHYCHVSSYYARNAQLEEITFDSMTVTSGRSCRYIIPFDPPLASWSEVRPRVVAMNSESVKGLKRSNITVKKYMRPKGVWIAVPFLVAGTMVAFSKRSNFEPGSFLYDHLLKSVPDFAKFCHAIQPYLLPGVIMIHTTEAAHMASSRLEKHSVPRFSSLWWKWIISTFFEGAGAFMRLDRIVADEEERKAKIKH
ncbi:hypothetical protein MMC34_000106 [Xylographa carneopallida]|nr:hypothetical protein [Xylographa carneopallida]